jgi:dihydrofolate reductase
MGHIMGEWIRRAGGFVLGRKTYEIFAAHWPHVTNEYHGRCVRVT